MNGGMSAIGTLLLTQSGHHRGIAKYRSSSYLSFRPVQKTPIVQLFGIHLDNDG